MCRVETLLIVVYTYSTDNCCLPGTKQVCQLADAALASQEQCRACCAMSCIMLHVCLNLPMTALQLMSSPVCSCVFQVQLQHWTVHHQQECYCAVMIVSHAAAEFWTSNKQTVSTRDNSLCRMAVWKQQQKEKQVKGEDNLCQSSRASTEAKRGQGS